MLWEETEAADRSPLPGTTGDKMRDGRGTICSTASIGTGGNSTQDRKNIHQALTNELKRPSVPRSLLPEWIKNNVPEPVALDREEFAKNFRTSRRGAAPSPAGMSVKHLRPLLEHETELMALVMLANSVARRQMPPEIVATVRLGWMTVLQKRDGRSTWDRRGRLLQKVGATNVERLRPAFFFLRHGPN